MQVMSDEELFCFLLKKAEKGELVSFIELNQLDFVTDFRDELITVILNSEEEL